MLKGLLWILRLPFMIASFAIKMLLAVILMPLKMLALGLLINVAMLLGLIAIVLAVIYLVIR